MPKLPKLSPRTRKVLRYGITAVILIAVAILFYKALADNWHEVREQHLGFNWRYVVALALFAVAVPLSGLLWGRILKVLSPLKYATAREAMALHCASWLLKYIPGQVGSAVNKVLWGQKVGLSRTLIAVTFIYENVFLQLASIVPSAVILLFTIGFSIFAGHVATFLLPLIALIPLAIVLEPRIFHWCLSLVANRFLKQPLPRDYFLSVRRTLQFFFEYIGPRILNSIGFVLIAIVILPHVSFEQWLLFGAAYTLAGAVGILAVFVPSGLGVRELVIVAVLAASGVSASDAVLISVLSRLVSTIADGFVALIYGGLRLSLRGSAGIVIHEINTKETTA